MGFFDFLKGGEKGPPIRDLVWPSNASKFAGLPEVLDMYPQARLMAWSRLTRQRLQEHSSQSISVQLAGEGLPSRLAGEALIFLAHHPSLQAETDFHREAAPKEVIYLSSAEDPLFNLIGGDQIGSLMTRMGIKEGEYLENRMISQAIQRAQKKVDAEQLMQNPPPPVDEWLRQLG